MVNQKDWYKIDIPREDGVYEYRLEAKKLCLIIQDRQVFVTSKRCPHAGADLTQGWCEGQNIVCPYHRHRFDLASGKGEPGQRNFIHVYETKYESGDWYVHLPKPWWKRLF